MTRIRNAAMLAAVLAIAGPGQATARPVPRTLAYIEDALTTMTQPKTPRAVDPEEKHFITGLDYTQESRLNERYRVASRQKERERKEQYRIMP